MLQHILLADCIFNDLLPRLSSKAVVAVTIILLPSAYISLPPCVNDLRG
jgi:hypothetical protein